MSVCGILCGADDWNSIRLFAEHKEDWFRKHLTLPGGIPVAITFNRIFASCLGTRNLSESRWVEITAYVRSPFRT